MVPKRTSDTFASAEETFEDRDRSARKRRKQSQDTDRESHESDPERDTPNAKGLSNDEDAASIDDQDDMLDDAESLQDARQTVCAEAGVIESVTLIDFMCHQNLSIDLGANMNFIIGHNGSGKSAILTAITVCLGGKAAISGRGSSLKTLVRQGQSQGSVIVKLRNRGHDAFKPELYGNSIIIERKIFSEGGGSYTIKDHNRTKKSTKREDLDAITDHFGLAIENPMNVLSQDTARQFLANATPKILYDLFMRGIELQQLEADHNLLSENIDLTNITLAARAHSLDKLHEQEAEAAKRYDETHRARAAHDELDAMKDKMAWVQVRDVEQIRDQIAAKVSAETQNVETLMQNLATNTRKETDIRAEIDVAEEQLKTMRAKERDPIADRLKESQIALDENKVELQRFQTDIRECHTQIKRQDYTIESTRKSIATEQAALEANEAGIARQNLLDRKVELDDTLGKIRDEMEDLNAQYSDINQSISTKQDQVQEASRNSTAAQRSVDQQHEILENLRNVSRNSLASFHPNMEKLLRAIEEYSRNGRWQEKPLGPLGVYMKLKHREWSDIVENFWGKNINGFLVSSFNDKNLLLKLMRDLRVQGCPVLQGKDREFSIDEPAEQYLTVLRAIEWSNDRIKRQLIITNRPEGQLLIHSRQEAELTMDPMNPPKNAIRAFAIDSHDKSRGFVIGGGPRGSSNQSTVNPYRHSKRLTTNSANDLEECQAALEVAKEHQRSVAEISRLLQTNLQGLRAQKSAVHERRADSIKLQQRYEKELSKIKDELEVVQTVDDGKLRGLEESLVIAEQQKSTYTAQYRAILSAKQEVVDRQKEIKARVEEIKTELAECEERLTKLQPRMLELTLQLQVVAEEKVHYSRQLGERQRKVSTYEERLKEAQAAVEEHIAQASQICERVEVDESDTVARLERRLQDKLSAIRRIEQRYGGSTVAQITERLTEARENLRVASLEVDELRTLVDELGTALTARQKSRKAFQKFICVRTKNNFVRHLAERDFVGRLSFDHKSKELHTHVTPADVTANMKGSTKSGTGSSKKKSSDNKVLSGGEKSFTTICLLLSIWEAMGCPIRALDEFDVFMDSVNRGISMRMMIESANDSVDKQFIIITPLDMGGVQPTPTTKIHRLKDPVRGVTGSGGSAGTGSTTLVAA